MTRKIGGVTGNVIESDTNINSAKGVFNMSDQYYMIASNSGSKAGWRKPLGTDQSNPASSGEEIWKIDNSVSSGNYWIDTPNGGVKQIYCDMVTCDKVNGSGTAGWMLAGSFGDFFWSQQRTTTSNSITSGLNAWSSNFGDFVTKMLRVHVHDTIGTVGPSAVADWYYWTTSPIAWKRWWTTNGTQQYVSTGRCNNVNVNRNALRQFSGAYNLKYGVDLPYQTWNNLSDGDTTDSSNRCFQGNWDTGLTTSGTSIGCNGKQDGSVGLCVYPRQNDDNASGQDCGRNNAKWGKDDNTDCYRQGTSALDDIGQTGATGSMDQNMHFYIK